MNARCTRPSDDEAPTPTDRDRDDHAAEASRQPSLTSTQDPSGQGSLTCAAVPFPRVRMQDEIRAAGRRFVGVGAARCDGALVVTVNLMGAAR